MFMLLQMFYMQIYCVLIPGSVNEKKGKYLFPMRI